MAIEEFNEAKNLARVTAGFKGGPFNKNPNTAPKMTFVDGYPSEAVEKLQSQNGVYPGGITDPWVYRYPNAKMK
jgi:hypothetical protein